MKLCLAHRVFISIALIASAALSGFGQTRLKKKELKRSDREVWRKVLKWPDRCEQAFHQAYSYPSAPDYGGLKFFSLDRQQYLVRVSCWGGAYQPGFMFMYYDERNPPSVKPLKLKGYESEDDDKKPLQYSFIDGLDTFNEKSKLLEVFSKYRGPGDCGRLIRYKVVGERLVVVEARERKCDEIIRRPTDSRFWPRIKL